MNKIEKNGTEMSHKEFVEYVKRENAWFESTSDVLLDFEKDGNLLSEGFCNIYELLLERRLECCIVCSDYFRAMYEKSFWFMKGRVMRRAKMYESLHKMTLQELITLKTYMKLDKSC